MLFANVKTEEDIEKLKKRIIKDPVFSIRLERVRKAMQYPKDGVLHTDKRGVGMRMPTKAEVLALYRELVEEGAEPVNLLAERALRKLKTKSNSGIAVVSLLTKPFPCPGRCTYCPTEENMPKSYLSKEPAAARALMNDFDPYLQITNRLKALEMNGHPVDKIEMIVIGGTWSFYHPAYQEEFLIGCYRACNDYGPGADSSTGASTELSRMSSGRDSRNEAYTDRLTYLLELQDRNEHARCRIIGLSIETRPDYITDFEIERLRALGVTKVEIGVQHLDDDVLKLTKRDMKIKQVKEATERLRNAGFKIVYHMMPNLPGSTKARDIAMFGELFSGEDFQPDMLKIYPCMVLEHSELYETWKKGLPAPRPGVYFVYAILCNDDSFYIGQTADLAKRYREHEKGVGAEHTKRHRPIWVAHYEEYATRNEAVAREKELKTGFGRKWLQREWKSGRTRQAGGFTAYTDQELIEVVRGAKKFVPPYVRILRVYRDIPASYIKAGSTISNLRQEMDRDMQKNGWQCKCIRCREIREGEVNADDFTLSRIEYRTKTGTEVFLSFEEKTEKRLSLLTKKGLAFSRLVAFTRLRLPDQHGENAPLSVLHGAALIRELHTYGRHTPVGGEGEQSQHVGFGRQLMAEAERIAKDASYKKLAVISGIGVREYYRKLGYHLEGTYMVKYL